MYSFYNLVRLSLAVIWIFLKCPFGASKCLFMLRAVLNGLTLYFSHFYTPGIFSCIHRVINSHFFNRLVQFISPCVFWFVHVWSFNQVPCLPIPCDPQQFVRLLRDWQRPMLTTNSKEHLRVVNRFRLAAGTVRTSDL